MEVVEMNQERIIRAIEQQLENLTFYDDDLAYEYECELYYDCEEGEEPKPIVEKFTRELLIKLIHTIQELDND